MEKELVFEGVSKSYDGKATVVDNLNLNIRAGEFLTLLGPSGSGKTTTLMMLAGFETLTEGVIRYAGRDISRLPSHKRNFGFVFQNYALFPHLTVFENIAFPLKIRKFNKRDTAKLVSDALNMVRLPDCESRYPSELSGGQQQRIALARALVFKPEVVLMDEPLGALDKNLREDMQFELKEIHRRLGVTFVFVTHDQDEALTMSDRVAVFNNGKIVQIDSPKTIYDEPNDPFVAEFVGETNKIASHVEEDSHQGHVKLSNPWFTGVVRCSHELSAGSNCTMYVRPEYVTVTAKAAAGSSLKITIEDLVFRGPYALAKLGPKTGRR